MKKYLWYEEYKHCSCTTIEKDKSKLPGYYPRHANITKIRIKLPYDPTIETGYIET